VGCCGQIEKPKNRQVQEVVQQQVTPHTPKPAQANFVNDNINSQRAAETLRENYHKRRLGNG
jgi:hypothetical protein